MADKWEELLTRPGVVLPPNRPHPTTHPHPALFKLLFSSLTELAGLPDIASSAMFLSSLLGGCTPRGVVGTAPQSWVSTSVSFILHHHLFAFLGFTGLTGARPLQVAIGSHWPYYTANQSRGHDNRVATWVTATPTNEPHPQAKFCLQCRNATGWRSPQTREQYHCLTKYTRQGACSDITQLGYIVHNHPYIRSSSASTS